MHAERDALLADLARLPRRQQLVLVLRYDPTTWYDVGTAIPEEALPG